MANIKREIDIREVLKEKSCFLLGPRQTGKSFLINQQAENWKIIDLLDHDTFVKYAARPGRLKEDVRNTDSIVVIDEIQKLPELLDEVHRLIEKQGTRFLLTGSSARKLRKQGVNLLGGRARNRHLHPLTFLEMEEHGFDLIEVLNYGSIPSIYLSSRKQEDLAAYVSNYLQLEVMQEGFSRNLPAFSRFLEVAARGNGNQINFKNIANDAQIAPSTVRDYFSILKDTLIAEELEAWRKTKIRRAVATSKYYLFDIGVVAYLADLGKVRKKSPDFGSRFEAWMHHELISFVSYHPVKKLNYWRSTSNFEVDFVLDNKIAIEIKAKKNVSQKDLKSIRALKEEGLLDHYYVVSMESTLRVTDDDIKIVPWQEFLKNLWDGNLI